MTGFTKFIANVLYESKIISEDEISIIRYGIEVFILSVFEVLSIIVISIFAGNFAETLLYFAAFIPLRVYAGGYHADTRIRCYIILVAVYVIFYAVIRFVPPHSYIMFLTAAISVAFSVIVIIAFSPIKNHAKKSGYSVRSKYRKISIILLLVQVVAIAVLVFKIGINTYLFAFILGQLSAAISMIAAIIKNFLRGEAKKDE